MNETLKYYELFGSVNVCLTESVFIYCIQYYKTQFHIFAI